MPDPTRYKLMHKDLHIDLGLIHRAQSPNPSIDLRLRRTYPTLNDRLADIAGHFPSERQNREVMSHFKSNLKSIMDNKGITVFNRGTTRVTVATGFSLKDLAKVKVEY